MVVMGKGEGDGDRSFPTGQGILGRNRHRACHLLHKTFLETSPMGVFRRKERGAVSHVITFVDDVAMHIPTLDTWDQFVWPLEVAVPRATTEVEQYGYRQGHTIDLGPVMPVTQFKVMDEAEAYLCAARALVFEGSILAYNPARDEAEWVPTCGIMNDLSWVEEKSAVVLVNYVPRISQEAARIAGLGTHRLVSWPDDSSLEEEDDGQAGEEEDEQDEEEDPMDAEEQGEVSPEPSSGSTGLKQGETKQEVEPQG